MIIRLKNHDGRMYVQGSEFFDFKNPRSNDYSLMSIDRFINALIEGTAGLSSSHTPCLSGTYMLLSGNFIYHQNTLNLLGMIIIDENRIEHSSRYIFVDEFTFIYDEYSPYMQEFVNRMNQTKREIKTEKVSTEYMKSFLFSSEISNLELNDKIKENVLNSLAGVKINTNINTELFTSPSVVIPF